MFVRVYREVATRHEILYEPLSTRALKNSCFNAVLEVFPSLPFAIMYSPVELHRSEKH